MVARSKEGAEASIEDGQLAMEEHTTTERGRPSLESMGHLYCRESQKYSLQLPKHRASTVGQGGAAGGKLECHKPQGWERAHSVCQEEGLALTRPLSTCFGHPRPGSCYRDSSGNRGRGRKLNRGEGQFHTAKGECFPPDHETQHIQHTSSSL